MAQGELSRMPLKQLHITLRETTKLINLNQFVMPFESVSDMIRYREMIYKELHMRKFRWCLQEMCMDRIVDSIPEDLSCFIMDIGDSILQVNENCGETALDDEHNVEIQEFSRLYNINNEADSFPNWEFSSFDMDMSLDDYFDDINSVLGIEPTLVITLNIDVIDLQ
ncbi:uncharacterized protein LOC143197702 [Rhynchophorus ferrugineus]|uniref:uncharacterized protein LOC143197702 n=1 Tax=Rhynchophorus ferrugineus TaxID=354439 RepID=UPI003FCDBD6B